MTIIKSISDDIQAVLTGANCILGLDSKVSDIARLARIPGTINSNTKTVTKIIDYDMDYYTFEELLKPKTQKKKSTPKKKTKNIEFGQALHISRLASLEKLQECRNFDCTGYREYMCFAYYNAAVQVYDRETAYNKLEAFRDKFNDVRAVPDCQLKALANCIDRNEGSDYESFYKLRNDWFVQHLAITPDEIAKLGMFQLSKRELKKQKNKQDKQEQAMQVIELAANGMKHQTIADTVGISKRKVQYILKAAGVTRGYNRKAA